MTHRQHPIGTGFTPASTAEEVIAGIDLSGRNVVITGGHLGLGHEVTRVLTGAGASVTVGARDPERAAAGLEGIERVEIGQLDLVDPASIEAFVQRWLATGRPLHILINNAAAAGGPVHDARGFETMFATNHLGHFQLTLGLLPALHAAHGARVVNVSSGAQRFSDIRWDDPNFTTGYLPLQAYAQSKTANVLFAVELDRRWAEDGIRGYAVHPGVVVGAKLNNSKIKPARRTTDDSLRAQGLIDAAGKAIIDPVGGKKTVPQGASTIVFAATSPLLANIGGVYLKDNDISRLDDEQRPLTPDSIPSEVASHSIDPQSARRLWDLSERLLAK